MVFIPNKRKSVNQNGPPQSEKKFKPGKLSNSAPQKFPNQQQKQGFKIIKKEPVTPKTPQSSAAFENAKLNIKKEKLTPATKTPKLEMFSGTGNLESLQNISIKKEPPSAKKQPPSPKKQPLNAKKQTGNAEQSQKEVKQNPVSAAGEGANRHKRRRERLKYKREETRQKLTELQAKIAHGDQAARQRVEESLRLFESITVKSKNCNKKIRRLKIMLGIADQKPQEGAKVSGKDKKQKKVAAKNQHVAQKDPPNQIKKNAKVQEVNKQNQLTKDPKQNQSSKLMKVNKKRTKVQQTEWKSEDESAEESSVEEEELSSEEASDQEDMDEEEESDEEASGEDSSGVGVKTASSDDVDEESEDDDEESEDEEEEVEDDDSEGAVGSEENDSIDDGQKLPTNLKGGPKQTKGEPKQKQQLQVMGKNKANKQDSKETQDINEIITRDKTSRYVVFVGNMPYSATKDDLTEHFKKAGDIVDIRIPTDKNSNKPKGFAYVEFKNSESYQKALSLHHTFIGGRRINVLYTQSGHKKGEGKKNEIKAKNFKLQAMRKKGMLAGSIKANQKRSVRRGKKKQFEKKP